MCRTRIRSEIASGDRATSASIAISPSDSRKLLRAPSTTESPNTAGGISASISFCNSAACAAPITGSSVSTRVGCETRTAISSIAVIPPIPVTFSASGIGTRYIPTKLAAITTVAIPAVAKPRTPGRGIPNSRQIARRLPIAPLRIGNSTKRYDRSEITKTIAILAINTIGSGHCTSIPDRSNTNTGQCHK